MAHVELSLSESLSVPIQHITDWGSVDRWTFAVDGATRALPGHRHRRRDRGGFGSGLRAARDSRDQRTRSANASTPTCCRWSISRRQPPTWPKRGLRIPPVLALTSGRLARGLMRTRAQQGEIVTMDAVSTPLREGDTVIGSLTFFGIV